jgi:hypothetical protein
MRKTTITFMVIAVLGLLLLASPVFAAKQREDWVSGKTNKDWCVLCLDKADLRYQKFRPDGRRDPYTPDHDNSWDARAGLEWDLQLLRWGFWRNDVHTEQLLDGRVKTVGWHWTLGIRIPRLRSELFHEHHSQHVLDQRPVQRDGTDLPQGFRKFPVEDSYGIRITLFDRRDGR